MFEVNGFIGKPLGFGVFTDVDMSHEHEVTVDEVGIAPPADEDVVPSYAPVFNVMIEFVNKETKEAKLAFNNFGISYGKRLIDDNLLICFNVSDASFIGEGEWDVNVSVDELTSREHVFEDTGLLIIEKAEEDHVSKALSDSWFSKSVKGTNIIEDWDFGEKTKSITKGVKNIAEAKQNYENKRNNRLQTCIDCEFFSYGACLAEDEPRETMPMIADENSVCPKGYWEE